MKSLNTFADHAPKTDWLDSFFDLKEVFFNENYLSHAQYSKFRRFLHDAGLIEARKEVCTKFFQLICQIGWRTDTALGLMMINLAMDNPQIAWYVNALDFGYRYDRKRIEEELIALGVSRRDTKTIIRAFQRVVETPFGTNLNFGYYENERLCRLGCRLNDNRVFLYALYRFIEKRNLYKGFNVSYLFDNSVDGDGISPVRLFGIFDQEELRSILLGLSARYPEFINATYTNNLQSISLRDKSASDVLRLFKEEL